MLKYNTNKAICQVEQPHRDSLRIANVLHKLGYEKKARNMQWCGVRPVTATCKCKSKIIGGLFCQQRWCPMCQKMRSRHFVSDTVKILHEIQKTDRTPKFCFMTLTLRNCKGTDLPKLLDKMIYGWKRLVMSAMFKAGVQGFVRAIEVTYNAKTDTYHPHIHALLYVKANYFDYQRNKKYMTQARVAETWGHVCGIDYVPIVDIRKVRNKSTGETDVLAAVPETLKYSMKTKDLLAGDEVLQTFITSLSGRRMISYGGILKTIKHQLGIKDIETDDAPITDEEPPTCTCPICLSPIKKELWEWSLSGAKYEYKGELKT